MRRLLLMTRLYGPMTRALGALALLVISVLILGTLLIARCDARPPNPPLFQPIEVVNPLIVFPDPLVIGQPAKLTNGLCNTSDRTQRLFIDIVLQPLTEQNTIITTNAVILSEGDELILASGECEGIELLVEKVPEVPPGPRWRLFIHYETMGPQANQVQRGDLISNIFGIVGASP